MRENLGTYILSNPTDPEQKFVAEKGCYHLKELDPEPGRSWDLNTLQVVYLGSLKESLDSGLLKEPLDSGLPQVFLKMRTEDSSS